MRFRSIRRSRLLLPVLLLPALAVAQTTYTPYTFTTVAGQASIGGADGTGCSAQFNQCGALVVDSQGNTYLADTDNSTIRKITPAGVVTTFAGATELTGSTDGVGTAARFFDPAGIAMDAAGNLYVADTGNCHDPENHAGRRGHHAGRFGGHHGRGGRHRQRGAVPPPVRDRGGRHGQRLCVGLSQQCDPEDYLHGDGDHLCREGPAADREQHGWNRQQCALRPAAQHRGGQRRQCLCGGQRQQCHSQDHAGGGGDHAGRHQGRPGRRGWDGDRRPNSMVRTMWRSTPPATSMWRTRSTARSARSRRRGW